MFFYVFIFFRNVFTSPRRSELNRREDVLFTNQIVDLTLNNIIVNGIFLREILKYRTDNKSKMTVEDRKDIIEFDFVVYSLLNNLKYNKCKL